MIRALTVAALAALALAITANDADACADELFEEMKAKGGTK
jgi:hypothetical protein